MSLSTSYGTLLKMAMPIMFGTFVSFIVVLIDNAFLSRLDQHVESARWLVEQFPNISFWSNFESTGLLSLGAENFNAAGLGGLVYVAFFMLGVGLSSGIQIMIARRAGEKRYKAIGGIFNHGLVMLCGFAAIAFAFLYFLMPSWLEETMNSQEVYNSLEGFLIYRPWGYFVAAVNLVLVAFYVGIGRTNVLIYTMLITSVTNIFLDYGLIFGHWGFPAMGASGAALASFLSEATAAAFAVAYTFMNRWVREYYLMRYFKIYKERLGKMVKFCWPLMIQQGISLAAYAVFFYFVEQLGETELEASNVMRNLYLLVLVPVLGFSSVTKTYVSQLLAEERIDEMFSTLKRIIVLSLSITGVIMAALLVWPSELMSIINEDAKIIEQATSILHVVWGAPLIYALGVIIFSVIPGSGDTHVALMVETAVIVVYLCLAYYLTIVLKLEVTQVWLCEYLYFGLLAVVSLLYLKTGRWRSIQV